MEVEIKRLPKYHFEPFSLSLFFENEEEANSFLRDMEFLLEGEEDAYLSLVVNKIKEELGKQGFLRSSKPPKYRKTNE